jgi:hypothetical protein
VKKGGTDMNELFENNEFYRQLPDEVKEKIRCCKTEEEAMDILKHDMIPLPEDTLEAIAGGGFWDECGNLMEDWEFCRVDAR